MNSKCHEYNSPFYRALRKYGYDNFTFEILEICDVNELDTKEIEYIQIYNSFVQSDNSNGYNNSIGGNQGSRFRIKSEEEKLKISQNREYKTGQEHPFSKTVLYKGKIYPTIKDFVAEEDIPYKLTSVRCWLNGSTSMPGEYYDNGLMYIDEPQKRKRRNDDVVHYEKTWIDGVCFNTASECAEYCGINAGTLRSYLSKARRMPKYLYDRGLRYDKEEIENYEYFE